jgi:hypothetical protein
LIQSERSIKRMLRVQGNKRAIARAALAQARADLAAIERDRVEIIDLLQRSAAGGAMMAELIARKLAALDRQQGLVLELVDRALQDVCAETLRVRLMERLQRGIVSRAERRLGDSMIQEIIDSRYARASFR